MIKQATELNTLAGEAASIHLVQNPDGSISGVPKLSTVASASSRWLLLPQVGLNLQCRLFENVSIHAGAQFVKAFVAQKSGPQGASPMAQWPQYTAGMSFAFTKSLSIQGSATFLKLKNGAIPGAEASKANLLGLGLGLRYGF